MRKLVVAKLDETQGHYVYDLSLPLQERIQKKMFFPSGMAAANWLGVFPQRIYMNRRTKKRVWSKVHSGWFAVRIAHEKPEAV